VVRGARSGQTDEVEHLVSSGGYLGVFVLMVLESACVPVPSEAVMGFGGALAAAGRFDLVPLIALGTAANLVGSYLAYGIGLAGGRPLVERVGGRFPLWRDELARTDRFFERRGDLAVLVGRVLPVVRTYVSLPAGVARMPAVRFGVLTAVGCVPWTTALGLTGYELGSHWHGIVSGFSAATDAVAVILLAGIVAALVVHGRARRRAAVRGASRPVEAGRAPADP
jgi:membrane protein DedA with SNARE-associated domain